MRPFSNGSDYMDWLDQNCERCMIATWNTSKFQCPIQEALATVGVIDGEIPDEIADRVGNWRGELFFPPCGERQLDSDALDRLVSDLRARVKYLENLLRVSKVSELEEMEP